MNRAITGNYRATLTEQLLQTTGMPSEWASFTNEVLTIGGTMGGAAIIQVGRFRSVTNFRLPINNTNTASKIIHLEEKISSWLGEGTQFIRNKAGDPIFLSRDRLRKVCFDFERTYPHESPHLHFEHLVNGEWKEISRIYPIDMPHK
jgi:hypothetical protein